MLSDRSEQESSPEKYQQDLEWSKAAFPDDYQKRKPGRTAFADPQLCGKWKVRIDCFSQIIRIELSTSCE